MKCTYCWPVLCLLLVGCGSRTVLVKGRVLKNGEAYEIAKHGTIRMTFQPYAEGGTPANIYAANVDGDGLISVPGKQGKGIPPGRYQIFVSLASGTVQPFTREITGEEVIIDVGKTP